MNRDDQFDQIFHHYGGRLRRENVQPELMQILDEWLWFFRKIIKTDQKAREFITGDVHIDYVENTSLNAIATQVGRNEFIGLFLGATMFVYDAFIILATHPSVFSGVGEVRSVFSGVVEVRDIAAKDDIRRQLLRPDPRHFLDIGESIDKTRQVLAQGVTMIALFFLFGHEVGHLIYGHLRYLLDKSGARELVEYPAVSLGADELRDRRVFEFDADRHGAIVSLNWWGRWSESDDRDVRFGLNTFYLWGFSLGVLFRLMDANTWDPTTEVASTHPMPDVRFAHAVICGLEEVMQLFPQRVDEFKTEVQKASSDLNDLWKTLDLPAASFATWRKNLGKDVVEYRRVWEKLKDDSLDSLAWQRSNEIRAAQ